MLRKRSIALGLAAGVLVVATLTSLQLYVNWSLFDAPAPYAAIWAAEATEYAIWAALAPIVWTVDRRYGTGSGRYGRAFVLHLLLWAGFFSGLNALMTAIGTEFGLARLGDGSFVDLMLRRASRQVIVSLLIYGLILAAAILVREAGRRSRQRARLEAAFTEERLRYLRAQIQPHFLFNTLHGIAGMVREGEREDAVRMIGLLGRLLRRALAAEAGTHVELGEELEDVDTYVSIQRMRFGDRLHFSTDVPQDLQTVSLPGLMLQPLVENAIRHGFGPEGGRVEVAATRDDSGILLVVRDDGVGLSAPYREGIGLSNLRARLEAAYGAQASLAVRNAPSGGVEVRIHLPGNPRDADG